MLMLIMLMLMPMPMPMLILMLMPMLTLTLILTQQRGSAKDTLATALDSMLCVTWRAKQAQSTLLVSSSG